MRHLSLSLSPDARVRVLCIRVRVRVLTKGLESESLKIWTRVRLKYTVGLEYYITEELQCTKLTS